MKEFLKRYGMRLLVRIAVFAFFGTMLFFLMGRREKTEWKIQSSVFSCMSTAAGIRLYASDEKTLEHAVQLVRNSLRDSEKRLNYFDPASELARLNAEAHKKPFLCSPELWEILGEARRFYRLSGGSFDITITPLMKQWGFYRKEKRMPTEAELAAARDLTGLDKVHFDDKAKSVFFPKQGMSLNLGGIAKGWALDRAAAALRAGSNLSRGFLDLGGNVLALPDPPPNASAYSAGIADPFRPNAIIGVVPVRNEAVSTSGSYERYVKINGKHYTHIVNPKTGFPVENMISVSVLTGRAVDSDALSTLIFLNGPDCIPALQKKFPGLRVLLIRRKPNKPDEIEVLRYGTGWDGVREIRVP